MVWINQELVKYLDFYAIFKEKEIELKGSFDIEKTQEIIHNLRYLEKKLIPLFEKEYSALKNYAIKSGFGLEKFMDCFFVARGLYLKNKKTEIIFDVDMYIFRLSYVKEIMGKEIEKFS